MNRRHLSVLLISIIVLTTIVVYSADAAGIPKKAISTVARFIESDLPTTTVFTDTANTFNAGIKQTFQASSTTAGLKFAGVSSDPSSLSAGDMWRNTASDTLKFQANGGTQTLATLGQTEIFTGSITMNSLTLGGNEAAGGFRITNLGAPTSSTDASNANNLGLLGNMVVGKCSSGQILKYQNSNTTWTCQSDSTGITSLNLDSTAAQTISGASGNITVSNAGASHTIGLGSNVVVINKPFTISSADTFSGGATVDGLSENIVSKTGTYTIGATDDTVLANANSGGFTLTLPAPSASNTGKIYTIKKTDSTTNAVTVSGSIDGVSSSVALSTPERLIQLQSDGSAWNTINGNNTIPYARMDNTSSTITPGSTNTATKIAFNNNEVISGITHPANGHITAGQGGDITVLESGIYRIILNGNFQQSSTTACAGEIWLLDNGAGIANSGARTDIAATSGLGYTTVSDVLVQLKASDVITVDEVVSGTTCKLTTTTPTGGLQVPAVSLDIFKIGG